MDITNASGAEVESTNYMPFGGMRAHSGTTTSKYKFTDQELDAENGLYNYNARLYDPIIGRFISPDTIVQEPFNPQSLNRYTYCLNNPLIYTDPSGHNVWSWITEEWRKVLEFLGYKSFRIDDDSLGEGKKDNKQLYVPYTLEEITVYAYRKGDRGYSGGGGGFVGSTTMTWPIVAGGGEKAAEVVGGVGFFATGAIVIGTVGTVVLGFPSEVAPGTLSPAQLAENAQKAEKKKAEKAKEALDVDKPAIPEDPSKSPGEGWEWHGSGAPETGRGNWVNDKTGQKLHPDINHEPPKGPHWGLTNPDGSKWDYFPGKGWIPEK